MNDFFDYLSTHSTGIFMLFLCLVILVFLINWLFWIFGIGRFGKGMPTKREDNLRFVLSDAAVKIINDFRHLLALIIIMIFAFALGYALIKASREGGGEASINYMKESLQAVVATLGGLVGSIIGYYFGESTVTKAAGGTQPPTGGGPTTPAVQTGAKTGEPPPTGITEAPAPPAGVTQPTPPLAGAGQ